MFAINEFTLERPEFLNQMKREIKLPFKSRPAIATLERFDRRMLIKFEQRPRSSSSGNSGDTTLKRNEWLESSTVVTQEVGA